MAPHICAKSAVLALSECLDSELRAAGERVSISVVLPGPVLTRILTPSGTARTMFPPQRWTRLAAWRDGMAQTMQDRGLSPEVVAEQVLDAIRAGRFFVLPHPAGEQAAAERRLRRMTEALSGSRAGTADWSPADTGCPRSPPCLVRRMTDDAPGR
jgi:short-subunit dehydrogenase